MYVAPAPHFLRSKVNKQKSNQKIPEIQAEIFTKTLKSGSIPNLICQVSVLCYKNLTFNLVLHCDIIAY